MLGGIWLVLTTDTEQKDGRKTKKFEGVGMGQEMGVTKERSGLSQSVDTTFFVLVCLGWGAVYVSILFDKKFVDQTCYRSINQGPSARKQTKRTTGN